MRRFLLLPLFAALLAGCGDDELAPVEAPGPDLTTVEGAVTALEDAYSYQQAGDALPLYAAAYAFTPALPESVPFFEPSDTAWALDVETDVVEYMLAGATAVEIGFLSFRSPTGMITIIEGLEQWCRAKGFERVADLTGAMLSHPPRDTYEAGMSGIS